MHLGIDMIINKILSQILTLIQVHNTDNKILYVCLDQSFVYRENYSKSLCVVSAAQVPHSSPSHSVNNAPGYMYDIIK